MTQDWTFSSVCRAQDIDVKDWATCVPAGDTLRSQAFFTALEQSGSAVPGTGWSAVHTLLKHHGKAAAMMPLYIKSHSMGEYVFDHAWAEAFDAAGGHYYPKLIGCIPFTPAGGPRIWVSPEAQQPEDAFRHMARHVTDLCQSAGISSAHLTFCTEDEALALQEEGWLTRCGLQYHWHNAGYTDFNGFLDTLNTRKRKMIRKEREAAAAYGLTFDTMTGSAISAPVWAHIYQLYCATTERRGGNAYLTPEFFPVLAGVRGDDIIVTTASASGEIIAAAINILSNDTLYGRYWCCDTDLPALHFELCYYRAIEWAIARNLKRVEAGAQGTHKIARGYRPQYTWSAHFVTQPAFREAVRDFLVRETVALAEAKRDCETRLPFKKDNCD